MRPKYGITGSNEYRHMTVFVGQEVAHTPSTGLRHPSEEGAGKRCSECGGGPVWLAAHCSPVTSSSVV